MHDIVSYHNGLLKTKIKKNFLHSAAFLFNEDSECVENNCNFARLGKAEMSLLFQARKIDLRNKMRTVIELIGIGILIKELEEVKV